MSRDPKVDAVLAGYERADAPGFIVGVAQAGKTTHRSAHGLADVNAGKANAVGTVMQIGSISKSITAGAVLLAQARGLLNLEDPVTNWLPELPVNLGAASLRQLLEHRGGYRCYLDADFASGTVLRPPGAGLQWQCAQTTVEFAPGEAQLYSNSGYHLLSLVLERACGQPLEQIFSEWIFGPLGMVHSVLWRGDQGAPDNLARAYLEDVGGRLRDGFHVSAERLGDGGVCSTVDDLLIWAAAARGAGPLGEQIGRDLSTPRALPDGSESNYGAGAQVRNYRGVRTIGHGGAVVGGRAHWLSLPDQELDVVVMANAMLPVDAIAYAIVDVLASDDLDPRPSRGTASDHQGLVGRYHSQTTGRILEVVKEPSGLAIRYCLGGAALLNAELSTPTPVGELRIEAPEFSGASIFVRDGGRRLRYDKLQAPVGTGLPSQAQGRFANQDLDAELIVSDAATIETIGKFGASTLERIQALGPDVFGADSLGGTPFPTILELEHDQDGRIRAICITTSRSSRLRFEKVAQ